MNNVSNKKFVIVHYIKNEDSNQNKNNSKKKKEKKTGYVTIEISRVDDRKFANKKRKNQLMLDRSSRNDFPSRSSKNISKKKIKDNTWTNTLLDKLQGATTTINQKITSFFKICIFNSKELKMKNDMIVRDSFKYFNTEDNEQYINSTNLMNTINGKMDNILSQHINVNNDNLYSKNFNMHFNDNNNINNNFMKDNILNGKNLNNKFANKKMIDASKLWKKDMSANNVMNYVDKGKVDINNNPDMQNIKNFYISVINKKNNVKNVRKVSLMEICKDPYFYISQNFLSDLESYLALNHCLLYIKKNKGELSQIHHNFFSVLINVDDVHFLEENVSTSILRHTIKRLNSLFKIPIDDITSVEFCLYLKNSEENEPIIYTEKDIYQYSILIFLSSKSGNFIEFPFNGLRIMTVIGNCLIYQCNDKKNTNKHIFNFNISDEKLFFLKINLKENIHLYKIFQGQKPVNHSNMDEGCKQNKITELYTNVFKNKNTLPFEQFMKTSPNETNTINIDSMKNHYSLVKKNMECINKRLMELNINRMRSLFIKAKNARSNNAYPNPMQFKKRA
ncbi:conserved Plasmodium protein, unknown function [Plasmodium sp. gorilla clade G2]|uniref:conserved Plasmodium protein, unknown function n=1 Tax=Plasmodium sp. gorilla clade G2 TaxID=880535 RepID=UPI000D224A68|nr:conserved Plasmodium protein, unknown function [Plasmodium sp. gorilla clade G2]SOV18367.1 conserved Plasmodium protein, unknown function [Plasmodium sp. gorilla clade G2]